MERGSCPGTRCICCSLTSLRYGMGRRLWVFVDLSFASTHYDGWYSNKMRGQRRKRAEEEVARAR